VASASEEHQEDRDPASLHGGDILRWLVSLLVAGAPIATWAAAVTVLDPEGRPVADTLVMCLDPEESSALTDAEGVATVPDACSAVSCWRGGHLPGRARVEHGAATCRLTAGQRVTVALELPGCADFHAGLVPVDVAGDNVRSSVMEPEEHDSGGCVARLGLAVPGERDVWVGDGRGWTCQARIVLSPEDADDVVRAIWRSPLELAGTVLDAAGRPATDIPVRVRDPVGDDPPAPEEWWCTSRDSAADIFTADDGSFHVLVDPDRRSVIEAGSSWDPDGFASLEVGPLPVGPVVLRLRR